MNTPGIRVNYPMGSVSAVDLLRPSYPILGIDPPLTLHDAYYCHTTVGVNNGDASLIPVVGEGFPKRNYFLANWPPPPGIVWVHQRQPHGRTAGALEAVKLDGP